MKKILIIAAIVVAAATAGCGGGTPAAPPSHSTTSSAFPVYKKGSSQYEALLACLFGAGYRHPAVSQDGQTLTMRGASVPAITFKIDPAAHTITPANGRTEVVLHTAGCPGAF